ncbi:MAG: chloramphenicol resistance protein, partial [Bacteroides sp.]|nr:chloramphenicol resistance protein [Bacteroides sp.]
MKNRILNLAVLLFAWLAASSQLWAQTATPNGSSHENNEFQQLMQKIRQDFATNPPAQEIEEALKTYNETDGSFSDVDYASIQRTLWPPLLHIDRLYDFAFAYTTPGNKYYENEALFDKIVKGLEYWYERNPWCHNWWYNQIAEPQRIGVMLIQLRIGKQQIPAELESKTLERIHKDGGHPAKWTGANRTDIALHW